MMMTIHDNLFAGTLPHYEQGRTMDVEHIRWMYSTLCGLLPVSGVKTDIVAPLVILHDIRYSALPAQNPFELEMRRAHMKVGAEVSAPLMFASGYVHDIVTRVCQLISIHDTWAFGEHEPYREYRELGILNDLDFAWMATNQGFSALCCILEKTPSELFRYIAENEKLKNRPFICTETEEVFFTLLSERKDELKI